MDARQTIRDLDAMLGARHGDAVALDEWGPHGLADHWWDCDACTDVPRDSLYAYYIRSYWRACNQLRR